MAKTEQSVCPKCGSTDLEFRAIEFDGDQQISYPFECNDCGCTGKEWYSLNFIEMTIKE